MTVFLSNEHINNFCEAVGLIPDAIADKDTRRLSAYYGASLFLLTGLETWPMLRRFCAGYIDIDGMLSELPLSSGEALVVRLAGNLYNGGFWTGTPLDLVSELDRERSELCINALRLRRGRLKFDEERGIAV